MVRTRGSTFPLMSSVDSALNMLLAATMAATCEDVRHYFEFHIDVAISTVQP